MELDKSQMIRYLKVVLRGQEGNELYCTLTSLSVYGQGMHVVMRNSLMELENTPQDNKNPVVMMLGYEGLNKSTTETSQCRSTELEQIGFHDNS